MVVLEKTLESPLDCKEIQPVHCEGDQPWDFFGRNDVKAETPVLWPPHVKNWLIGKDSDAGRDWGQEEKGTTEDEIWLDGHESEWTPGVGDGQGGLVCCNSWGRKESDTTEWLNWTELKEVKGKGKGASLQESCLENPMDGGAWWATVHGVGKSRTRLRDFTFTFHFHALEKEMATHSSVLAWRIQGTMGPGRLPSMGSHRIGHDWNDLAAAPAARRWKTYTLNSIENWWKNLKIL